MVPRLNAVSEQAAGKQLCVFQCGSALSKGWPPTCMTLHMALLYRHQSSTQPSRYFWLPCSLKSLWLGSSSSCSAQWIVDYGLQIGPLRGRPGGASQGSMGNTTITSRTVNSSIHIYHDTAIHGAT